MCLKNSRRQECRVLRHFMIRGADNAEHERGLAEQVEKEIAEQVGEKQEGHLRKERFGKGVFSNCAV